MALVSFGRQLDINGRKKVIITAHAKDAVYLEAGDSDVTAASWYGARMLPLRIDEKITTERETTRVGSGEVIAHHLPRPLTRLAGLHRSPRGTDRAIRPGHPRPPPPFPALKPQPIPRLAEVPAGPRGRHPLRGPLRRLQGTRKRPKFHPAVPPFRPSGFLRFRGSIKHLS